MKNKLYILLTLLLPFSLGAQTPQLIKDNFTGESPQSSGPKHILQMGNHAYFYASNRTSEGGELWRTDGTPGGTELFLDIRPGSSSGINNSSNGYFAVMNNVLYFPAEDGFHGGDELWRSDGTLQGTYQLKKIDESASSGSDPADLITVGNLVFFRADDDIHGFELWATDGTASGTVLVKDIEPGSGGSHPNYFVASGGKLFFVADDGTNGKELWVSDGTPSGTFMLKNIGPGNTDGISVNDIVDVNGTLFFEANDGTHGLELWKSDGTTNGTVLVKDIKPGAQSSGPNGVTNLNGTLYFTCRETDNDEELWKSDGTPAGTVLVKDIYPGSMTGRPQNLTSLNNNLLIFRADDGINGMELWVSDGTEAGTQLLKDINTGSGSSFPDDFYAVNGIVFFDVDDGTHGTELWKTDGTTVGTQIVKDINPGTGNSGLEEFASFNNQLLFRADNGTNGSEIFISDGTDSGTIMLKNIASDKNAGDPKRMTGFNDKVLYSAFDSLVGRNPDYQRSLFITDGQASGTDRLMIIHYINFNTSDVYEIGVVGSKAVFSAPINASVGQELGVTDGTPGGTGLLMDLAPGTFGSEPEHFTLFNNKIFFQERGNVWSTDGTVNGTAKLSDTIRSISGMKVALGQLFMPASSTNYSDLELWKSDGTEAGTMLVKNINPTGHGGGAASNSAELNGMIYFSAIDSDNYLYQLWKSDGTEAGTEKVADVSPGSITPAGNAIFFTVSDSAHGRELWISDGTTGGTMMVKDIYPGYLNSINNNSLMELKGKAIFAAYSPGKGNELWISDGTAAGTQMIKDIAPGELNGMDGSPLFAKSNGMIYFAGNDGAANFELWRSDGTAQGTVKVAEVAPGPQGSYPMNITAIDDQIYFSAFHPDYGRELWRVDAITGTNESPQKAETILVYPNPVRETLLIRSSEQGTGHVYNTAGQRIAEFQILRGTTEMNVAHLPQGMYLIQIGTETVKFVKK